MSWRDLHSELRSEPQLRRETVTYDAKNAIAVNVYRLRNERGMSQQTLAEEVGTGQPNISELERGDANPTVETLAGLAAALNTSVHDLTNPPRPSEPTTRVIELKVTHSAFDRAADHTRFGDRTYVPQSREPAWKRLA